MTKYKNMQKYINELLQDTTEWKLLSEDEKDKIIKYICENEDEVADVLHIIIKEKELN